MLNNPAKHARHRYTPPHCRPRHYVHNIVCQHQIGVEVWPDKAEVYFRDERYSDPVNTQLRFDAVIYNAPSNKIAWEVQGVNGASAAGSIDSTGLYQAPPKGGLAHGLTEKVVATSLDDPLRRAYALITLVGAGPAPAPTPRIDLLPKQVSLYYQQQHHNAYIDSSNKMQMFHATLRNSSTADVDWYVNDAPVGGPQSEYLYQAPLSSGATPLPVIVKIRAHIKATPWIKDEANIILNNYAWPGLL